MRFLLCLVVLCGCASITPKSNSIKASPEYRAVAPNLLVAWDASPDHAKLANYRLDASGATITNWNAGLALTYTPPLPPGDWTLRVYAVGVNGLVSDASNALALTVPGAPVFSYTVQFWTGLAWTNVTTMLVTNAPEGIFRVEMRKLP